MFRQLDYQDRVLTAIDPYLDLLKEKKDRSDRIIAALAARGEMGKGPAFLVKAGPSAGDGGRIFLRWRLRRLRGLKGRGNYPVGIT